VKGVDAVAKILKQEGVEYLFAYPNNSLIDSAAALGIRPIIARGEKTLINIADGYCRATNGTKPTVLCVQEGPGIENAFGGMAQAFADSIPVLIIPGGPEPARHFSPTNFDPIPPFQHITKWSARISTPGRVTEMLRRAFTHLRAGPPGPVLLELPRDVAGAEIDEKDLAYSPVKSLRSAGDPSDVADVAARARAAARPMILAGHGVLWAQAWDELRELAELLQAPVMTTMAAKSVFPENHPLSAGTGGLTLAGGAAHSLLRTDLVIALGTGLSKSGFVTPIPPGRAIVQITNNERDIGKGYAVDAAILGDVKLVARQLIDELRRGGARGAAKPEVAAGLREAHEEYLKEWIPRLTSEDTPINPYRVVWDINRTVDRATTVITHDSGNPRDQTLTFYEAVTPRGYLGWGKSTQLGTGLGLVMGAKLAFPEKLCINIMGDLAFGTAGMEIETAVRERIPTLTVILNNSRMGGYGHHMPRASERYQSNMLSGNYTRVAEGLGAWAQRVEKPGDVVPALRRAIEQTRQGRVALLEVITAEDPVYPRSADLLKATAAAY